MKVIRPHDPRWKDLFAAEAWELEACLAGTALEIQQVGSTAIPGRRYFEKAAGAHGVGFHVHIFARGSEHITRLVRSRDYLPLEPELARDYSALTRSLATSGGVPVADYAAREEGFVRRVDRLAQQHFCRVEE